MWVKELCLEMLVGSHQGAHTPECMGGGSFNRKKTCNREFLTEPIPAIPNAITEDNYVKTMSKIITQRKKSTKYNLIGACKLNYPQKTELYFSECFEANCLRKVTVLTSDKCLIYAQHQKKPRLKMETIKTLN